MDLIKYACKNFDRLFIEYTNYGIDVLIRIQMFFFYSLQPPQAKIINPYQPILEQNKSKFVRTYNTNSNQSENTFSSSKEIPFYANTCQNTLNNKNTFQYSLLRNAISNSSCALYIYLYLL